MSTLRIVGVSGGLSQPSRTTSLVREVLREIETLTGASSHLIEVGGVASLLGPHASRQLFSFFRAHTVPTSLYATAAQIDGGQILDPVLRDRIQIAARQAVHVLGTPVRRRSAEPVQRTHAAQ